MSNQALKMTVYLNVPGDTTLGQLADFSKNTKLALEVEFKSLMREVAKKMSVKEIGKLSATIVVGKLRQRDKVPTKKQKAKKN